MGGSLLTDDYYLPASISRDQMIGVLFKQQVVKALRGSVMGFGCLAVYLYMVQYSHKVAKTLST